ncbi:MAG: hypothetical protein ACE5JU_23495 [Candidatus Binatia bacterium]
MKEVRQATAHAILKLANRCSQRGEIYQATDLYQRLMEKYPRTPEGHEARRGLLKIAKQHEATGRTRLALFLYSKLDAIPGTPESSDEQASVSTEEEIRQDVTEKVSSADPMPEMPYVDLTEELDFRQNFERLGRVQSRHVDLVQEVNSLKELRGEVTSSANRRSKL